MPHMSALLTDHEITEEVLTIGRAPDNVFPIDDVSVSSHHAQIAPSAGIFLLKDLGSTNGTMVNGTDLQPDTEYTLKPGDKIRFGKVDSIFDPEHAEAPVARLDRRRRDHRIDARGRPAADQDRQGPHAVFRRRLRARYAPPRSRSGRYWPYRAALFGRGR